MTTDHESGTDYSSRREYSDWDLYSRRQLDRRELDPFYDERRLRRFVRSAWRVTGWCLGIVAVGGLLDLLGAIP